VPATTLRCDPTLLVLRLVPHPFCRDRTSALAGMCIHPWRESWRTLGVLPTPGPRGQPPRMALGLSSMTGISEHSLLGIRAPPQDSAVPVLVNGTNLPMGYSRKEDQDRQTSPYTPRRTSKLQKRVKGCNIPILAVSMEMQSGHPEKKESMELVNLNERVW